MFPNLLLRSDRQKDEHVSNLLLRSCTQKDDHICQTAQQCLDGWRNYALGWQSHLE